MNKATNGQAGRGLGEAPCSAYHRRKAKIESDVIKAIMSGCITVFWATENQERARAIDRMIRNGWIVLDVGLSAPKYPWCKFLINEERMPNTNVIEHPSKIMQSERPK